MKISATYNQQLTERIHMVMVRKFLILRSAKSISDRLLDPLAFAHQRLRFPIHIHAIHIDIARPDHPVNVNKALVRALLKQLRGIESLRVAHARAVGLPERDVTDRKST